MLKPLFSFVILILIVSCNTSTNKSNQSETSNLESITICKQIWSVQNLTASKYQNGDEIPQIKDATQWQNLTIGAWCWYNNDSTSYCQYGKLYNWYAVNDSRGLAPKGWHVPNDAEWNELIKCIDPTSDTSVSGPQSLSAGALKESGTSHWLSPNFGASDSSGFAGIPSGYRNNGGKFYSVGNNGYWWSSTENNVSGAWNRYLNNVDAGFTRDCNLKTNAFSVRLVKD
jgi:uncharacterized protein (TIGR02145 family)